MNTFFVARESARARPVLIAAVTATALLGAMLTAAPASATEAQLTSADAESMRAGTTASGITAGERDNIGTAPITIEGAAEPITTDTTYSCNVLHCTALLSKSQTKQMATGAAAAGAILTALCGPAAWACAIAIGLMVDTANRAENQGKCAGIRRLTTTAPVWPVVEPCRQ